MKTSIFNRGYDRTCEVVWIVNIDYTGDMHDLYAQAHLLAKIHTSIYVFTLPLRV